MLYFKPFTSKLIIAKILVGLKLVVWYRICILFGASLSEPWIHEVQKAVLYVDIYIYLYVYVCLWGDHFSEERVKFWTCKIMVVMRMLIYALTAYSIWETTRVWARHKTGKVSAVPLWQGSDPRFTILMDSNFLSMKMTTWRLIPWGPGYRYLDSWSWHVDC